MWYNTFLLDLLIIRFEGINTSELNKFNTGQTVDGTNTAIVNANTPSAKAKKYTEDSVKGRLIVLRINPRDPANIITVDGAYEPGSEQNTPENYATAYKGSNYVSDGDRYMATVFANISSIEYEKLYNSVRDLFILELESQFAIDLVVSSKSKFKEKLYPTSPMFIHFDKMYNALNALTDLREHLIISGSSDPLNVLTENQKKHFNILMNLSITNSLYEKASEWPIVGWDEYYEDGSPVTLNWELVTNGLAKIYMDSLMLQRSKAVITPGADESAKLEKVER